MSKAEFEEKSFEAPLMQQLLGSETNFYPPGQVLEKLLGFDGAVYSRHERFWQMWNIPPLPGEVIKSDWWAERPGPAHLPDFALNVFVQAKRPSLLRSKRNKEWVHWNREFFRYDLTGHQQKALVACANGLQDTGLVVYASPAFIKCGDLFTCISQKTLVENTNFVKAQDLAGHDRYFVCRQRNRRMGLQ